MANDSDIYADASKKLDRLLEQVRTIAQNQLRESGQKRARQGDNEREAANPLGRVTERTGQMENAEKATEALALNSVEAALAALGLMKYFAAREGNAEVHPTALDLEVLDRELPPERLALEGGAIDIDAWRREDAPQLGGPAAPRLMNHDSQEKPQLEGQAAPRLMNQPQEKPMEPEALRAMLKSIGGGSAEAQPEQPAIEGAGQPLALPEGTGSQAAAGQSAGAPAAGAAAGAVGAAQDSIGEIAGAIEAAVQEQAGSPAEPGADTAEASYKPFPLPERTGPVNAQTAGRSLTAGRR